MKFFSFLAALPLALAAPILDLGDATQAIANQWIVVLKDSATDSDLTSSIAQVTDILGAAPRRTYNFGGFRGMAINANQGLLSSVQALSKVKFISPDSIVRKQALTTQANPPYGLARISHRSVKNQNEYVYDSSAGDGTVIYGIDTGVYTQHNDFGGRATFGANYADKNNTDGNGHGTHTMGTAGGTQYGVAKKAQIIAVKVLDASGAGSLSNVMMGMQFAAQDMIKRGKKGKAVGNLSLGGTTNPAVNQAAAAAVKMGLFLAVAAGNEGLPALTSSPASEPSVCTVGATDKNDKQASFSNFGSVVDLYAPGVDVTSAWNGGPDDTETISGTSMAAPHVAGLGAYLLALEGSKDPIALCNRIKSLATKNAVSGIPILIGGANLLAYNGNGA